MVAICKTNVNSRKESMKLLTKTKANSPELTVNFDMEDCDKILRVEGVTIAIDQIKKQVLLQSYLCEALY